MTAEENKAIVRRLIEELWNAGNPELAEQFYAADHVRHGPHAEPPIRGSEALKHFAYMYLAAVPDLHHEIEDQKGTRQFSRTLVPFVVIRDSQRPCREHSLIVRPIARVA